ncbi:hypothetical protein K502DRAFT_312473 [Neoconidiobolus thromboides FSU 785]|nr:hypothetical protein K502DRAFT_312473 [Neoconidiobolus thromboides FSU 785]
MKFNILLPIVSLIVQVTAHSNMLTPAPRGNIQWWGYCSRGNGCNGACDAPKAASPFNSIFNKKTYVKRGETIPVEWLRQNHPGGFVRISFTTMDKSDEHSSFDEGTVKYICYETNCKEDHHDPMLGELNGPGFKKCSSNVKIPNNLPDGPVTLQWTWFGGGVLFADQKASFANYISCSDMMVKGGEPLVSEKSKPEFQGGDAAYKGADKCRYWSTNSVFGCPLGAEDNNKNGCGYGDAKFGAPAEWEKGNGQAVPSTTSTPITTTTNSVSSSEPAVTSPQTSVSQSAADSTTTSNVPDTSNPKPTTSQISTGTKDISPTEEPKYPVAPSDPIVTKEIIGQGQGKLVTPKKKCKNH